MEEKDAMLRWGKHFETIKRIGRLPLDKDLHLTDLGDVKKIKATTQACYNEMKKNKIKMSVIDYLCRLSTIYLVFRTGGDYKEILSLYSSDSREEVRNFLRYFMKNPSFFLRKQNKEVFNEIAGFWYEIVEKERVKRNI